MTWVVAEYTATPGTNEISVSKGQQVEVLDSTISSVSNAEFCLVRLSPGIISGGISSGTQEGLVPVSVLKPAPSSHKAGNRRPIVEVAADKEHGPVHAENTGELASIAIAVECVFLFPNTFRSNHFGRTYRCEHSLTNQQTSWL